MSAFLDGAWDSEGWEREGGRQTPVAWSGLRARQGSGGGKWGRGDSGRAQEVEGNGPRATGSRLRDLDQLCQLSRPWFFNL